MKKKEKAVLALVDGTVLEGWSFGAEGSATGEVVFHTGMSGYQEILTDPSYLGQMVTMTYTQIGNTGINLEDMESRKTWLNGFIVKEYIDTPSNYRADMSLGQYQHISALLFNIGQQLGGWRKATGDRAA